MQNQNGRAFLKNRLLKIAGDVAFVVDSDYWIEKCRRRNCKSGRTQSHADERYS